MAPENLALAAAGTVRDPSSAVIPNAQVSEREYSRRNAKGQLVTTNTVEGFFGLLKRGVNGVYHHWGRQHLHRYLSEFEFRYNAREISDGERTALAIKGIEEGSGSPTGIVVAAGRKRREQKSAKLAKA